MNDSAGKNCYKDKDDTAPNKKIKLDDGNSVTQNTKNVHENLSDLSDFKLDKILQNNATRKTVCLQGTFKENSEKAIVFLEKIAFSEEEFNKGSEHFSENGVLTKVFHNDIYGDYKYFPSSSLNFIKATIIHPATEKHIEKYTTQISYMIDETPDLYNNVVLPFIITEQLNLQWVYNILDHKSEADRIVFEDTDPENGFVLIPDLKWDGSTETLYLLAIVRQHDIKSLRELDSKHLPLLKNIRDKGIVAIEKKYGLDSSQLRIYVHYQPSFYHLHVHFTYLRYEAPGILAERAHLLSSIISNIEICPEFYQKATIPFVVYENSNLFKKLEENNVLKRVTSKNMDE